ncbi:MAG: TetR/AcrR family transcriptional regulator, partial [Nocardioides sp.]
GSLAEHRAQIHQRVFAAFADLLAERSFDAITMAQIAAGAEVGRTTIYHHFPDKESVVVAFATHETSRYLQRLEEVL